MLRKTKRFQSKKQFRATNLIASRQTRLHPLRQAGASDMVALTLLLLTAILSEAFLYKSDYQSTYDFNIHPINGNYTSFTSTSLHFSNQATKENVLTEQDVQKIRAIDKVHSVTMETSMDILLDIERRYGTQQLRDYYTEERLIVEFSESDAASLLYSFHNAGVPFIFMNSLAYLLEDI